MNLDTNHVFFFASCAADYGGVTWDIGNVHLESLGNPDVRREQLIIAERELRGSPNSVLCGDFK